MKTRTQWFVLLALLALAAPLTAQNCGTLYEVTQGNQTEWYGFNDVIVLKAGGAASIRVYYQSRARNPHTIAAQVGYPFDFGWGGPRPGQVRQTVQLKPQNEQQMSRGKANLKVGGPGQAALGYNMLAAYNNNAVRSVPEGCITGYINVRVVPRGR